MARRPKVKKNVNVVEEPFSCDKCREEVKHLWTAKPYDRVEHPWLCEKCFNKYFKKLEKAE